MWLSVGGLPANVIPSLLELFALLALVILLFVSIKRSSGVATTVVSLLIAIHCFIGGCAVSRARVFQTGFRHKIQKTISAEELRTLAYVARSHIPVGGYIPGPAKLSLWTEAEHAKTWSILTNTTSLGKLDPWVVIAVRDDVVELSWGGALVGHWGLFIRDVAPRVNQTMEDSGDIAPDISTFIGGN
jgi:hypothetical protein